MGFKQCRNSRRGQRGRGLGKYSKKPKDMSKRP